MFKISKRLVKVNEDFIGEQGMGNSDVMLADEDNFLSRAWEILLCWQMKIAWKSYHIPCNRNSLSQVDTVSSVLH